MKNRSKKIIAVWLGFLILASAMPFGTLKVQAAEKNIVVMIDPGHGGANMGGQYNTLDEKNLTLVTAFAMKAELEKYEGVTVHLTRTQDVDMSLVQRAQSAQNVSADYLFSLHYNMSVEHDFYGAEVWVPSTGDLHVKGYGVGNLFLDEFDKYGTFRRGIKTKLNSRGGEYYGIIREASKRGIPSVIVEHCHLDNPVDKPIYNSIENLQAFGRSDATAVAKYFGLKSSILGVDYSQYPKVQTVAPTAPISQDMTEPELSRVSLTYNDTKKTGMLGIKIEGLDKDSGIYYFSYSLDGGTTWSSLQTMPYGGTSVTIELKAPKNPVTRQVVARVYNGYDKKTESLPIQY